MSILTVWPEERYKEDAFDRFTPTRELNLGTALALMWVSQLAYEPDAVTSQASIDKVKRILKKWKLELAKTIAIPVSPLVPLVSRVALVISGRGAVIVAFAGTDPLRLQDWFVNFSALPGAAGVSEGFGTAANAAVADFRSFISQQNNPKVFVTGHSLGGAVGTALAFELSRQNICDVEAVYTYGMPRAGDQVFAADYNQRLGARTYRFVHGRDLVPTVPPGAIGLPPLAVRHQHVGFCLQCAGGAKFNVQQKSANTQTNEPEFEVDIEDALAAAPSFFKRSRVAFGLLGGGRLVDSIIELSPQRVRLHLQDQYIAALTP